MTTIVLVPGAWLGAAAWDAVAVRLEAVGHEVHPLTLPGLGERATQAAAQVRLADHVADVLDYLSARELSDVALVGHSYAGIVTGQVASCAPERVAHAVFLDSNLPRPRPVDGGRLVGTRRRLRAGADRGQRRAVAEAGSRGLRGPGSDRAADRAAAHPFERPPGPHDLRPGRAAAPLSEIRATYINCRMPDPAVHADAAALAGSPNWSLMDLDTGHWPMYSRPAELAELLDEIVYKA